MLQAIINTIFSSGTAAIQGLGQVAEASIDVVWNSTDSTLTAFGTILLIVGGLGIGFAAFKFIRGLVRKH